MLISKKTQESLQGGSWIRRMFEAGIALKAEHGENKVCDFSLGNPDLPPPPEVGEALRDLADNVHKPFSMGYMPNSGFPWARALLAESMTKVYGIELSQNDVILSCGAAGAMNAFFKAILDPEDEVLAISPCFVEYASYVKNHGGVFGTVQSKAETFELDHDAIEKAIGPKTRAIIINSPNNPTGQVYSRAELQKLCDMLKTISSKRKRPVFLLSDEPYRFLAFDGVEVPSILPMYEYAVLVSSFSKNLCIPGERVGYAILSPLMEKRQELMDGMILANRVLGYVNPPVVGQHILKFAINSQVDPNIYLARRNAMAEVLRNTGYEFFMPKGAFYFFPKAPGGDDVAFCQKLLKELVLAVPGTGFNGPGHFRMAFCVNEEIIYRAADGLKKANT